MSAKNILVLWSGGFDSTYLVYKNLQEGNNVFTIYNKIINSKDKIKYEKKH